MGWRLIGLLALLLALLPVLPGDAQAPVSQVELDGEVRETLMRLQDSWLQWTSAFYGEDEGRAGRVVDDMVATTEQLGMERLPDLAAGALVHALEASSEDAFERADLALASAERLDPGSPETAFVGSLVAWRRGDPLGAVRSLAGGLTRTLQRPLTRTVLLHDLGLWLLAAAIAAGALFVVLELLVRGPGLARDLLEGLSSRMPGPAALLVLGGLLLWPALFGWVWLLLYWGVLVWGRSSRSERVVLVGFWVLLGLAPLAMHASREQIDLLLSPSSRALHAVEAGELSGDLFADLEVLASRVPSGPAREQFFADLYLQLGQLDEAREAYRRVLEVESENPGALANLGAIHFVRGDFGNALGRFRQAVSADPANPAVHFSLAQAYSESYLFDEYRDSLAAARRLDNQAVSRWVQEDRKVVFLEGGFDRIEEIEERLAQLDRPAGPELSPPLLVLRRGASLLLAIGLVLGAISVAAALDRLRPPVTGEPGSSEGGGPPPGTAGGKRRGSSDGELGDPGWLAALVPGLGSVRSGRGLTAFGALFALTAILLLPRLTDLGHAMPWRLSAGTHLLPWVAAAALMGLIAARVLWTFRKGS